MGLIQRIEINVIEKYDLTKKIEYFVMIQTNTIIKRRSSSKVQIYDLQEIMATRK